MSYKLNKLLKGLCVFPLALTACQTTASAQPSQAVLIAADAESVRNLKSTLAKAMNTKSVQFGVADLEKSSKINALPTRYAAPPGAPQNSISNFGIPTTFTLMMDGNRCYLLKYGSDEKIPLENVACRPLNTL